MATWCQRSNASVVGARYEQELRAHEDEVPNGQTIFTHLELFSLFQSRAIILRVYTPQRVQRVDIHLNYIVEFRLE